MSVISLDRICHPEAKPSSVLGSDLTSGTHFGRNTVVISTPPSSNLFEHSSFIEPVLLSSNSSLLPTNSRNELLLFISTIIGSPTW